MNPMQLSEKTSLLNPALGPNQVRQTAQHVLELLFADWCHFPQWQVAKMAVKIQGKSNCQTLPKNGNGKTIGNWATQFSKKNLEMLIRNYWYFLVVCHFLSFKIHCSIFFPTSWHPASPIMHHNMRMFVTMFLAQKNPCPVVDKSIMSLFVPRGCPHTPSMSVKLQDIMIARSRGKIPRICGYRYPMQNNWVVYLHIFVHTYLNRAIKFGNMKTAYNSNSINKINGISRILKWRYCTIRGHILEVNPCT